MHDPAGPAFARRLLIVEDQALLRGLLVSAFAQRGFEVAAAASAIEARRLCRTFDPDAALVDVDLGPGPNGIDLAHALLIDHPYLAIAFLTDATDPRIAGSAPLPDRATIAFLGKSRIDDLDRLFTAVDAALSDASSARYRDDRIVDRPLAGLTEVQLVVLALAASGASNAAIAAARGTRERAVERVLASVYDALGIAEDERVNQRVTAVARFLAAGGQPRSVPTRPMPAGSTSP